MELFHAYIIGGAREDARKQIAEMLAPFSEARTGNADYVVSEHVTFTIDDVRELSAWQELSALGERKFRIVYTEFINYAAEHALLKTLEEPVPGTHLFFVLPNPDILMPTVLSRVRVVKTSGAGANFDDIKKFLSLSQVEKLAHIAKLVEKDDDDEDAPARVREQALTFANNLEHYLSEDVPKNSAKLEAILKLKKYLQIPGASAKMILETLALIA